MKTKIEVEKWLAIRKEAGRKIDPDTAEVISIPVQYDDPYGLYPEPPEGWNIGRDYFARSPGSEIWVWFGDLPDATSDALWAKHKANLAAFTVFMKDRPAELADSDEIPF
jgi:hypothetical protein